MRISYIVRILHTIQEREEQQIQASISECDGTSAAKMAFLWLQVLALA